MRKENKFIPNENYFKKIECCAEEKKEKRLEIKELPCEDKVVFNPCDFDWNTVYLQYRDVRKNRKSNCK